MLTLITGTPGAGKSLHACWEYARHVPGSTVEMDGEPIPRRLLSNVKNLIVEHQHIDGSDLENWHTWAQPGDVILFDEVQEVWRPRGLGSKVPDAIAKLETHRHMGVDLILVTQHPMLLDGNIRRLVNRHIHLRRITNRLCMKYEWDHASDPKSTRSCVDSGLWRHPKQGFSLYKSAQLHTKTTARVPKVAWVGLLAVAGMAYAVPNAYDRITTSLGGGTKPTTAQAPTSRPPSLPSTTLAELDEHGRPIKNSPTPDPKPEPGAVEQVLKDVPQVAGCIASPDRCDCFTDKGQPIEAQPAMCGGLQRPPATLPAWIPEPATVDPVRRAQDAAAFEFMAQDRQRLARSTF